MGANGSGKSTAALCMNGTLVPDRGEVRIDGMSTKDRSKLLDIRCRVGLVFQDPNLQFISMTVERELAFGLENLGVPRGEMHARVQEQLRVFDLKRHKNRVPSSLSGGEKQRLAIAAVMILQPKYLILDETTSLLSPASRQDILKVARELPALHGNGVILITQFPHEALLAERLVILHKGSVMYDDTPEAVFRHARELISFGIPVPLTSTLVLNED